MSEVAYILAQIRTAFDLIGDPGRRAILDCLLDGPALVNEVVATTGLSQPATSRHLRALREAGLVSVRKAGRHRIYELRIEGFTELARWLTPYVVLRQRAVEAHGVRSYISHSGSQEAR
jgi:DNA-binding transcriptional ArsR family regulator